MKCNLILIDGIFGSGKSTIAQFVSQYLSQLKVANIKYEEESENTPVYFQNCEEIDKMKEAVKFENNVLIEWVRLVNKLIVKIKLIF